MSYQEAKQAYAAFGVDTDAAIAALKNVPISVHCWQGDDVLGFGRRATIPAAQGRPKNSSRTMRSRSP